MELKTAETLVESLGKRSGILVPDKGYFIDVLLKSDVSPSSKFYKKLPDNIQEAKESDCYYSLSLDMVLRNRNAERDYKIGFFKRAIDAFASRKGIYSSDILTRRLRRENDIVDLMAACEQDFSLLARFEAHDYSNPNKITFTTRPILVVPGSENHEKVFGWEQQNTLYQKSEEESFKRVRYTETL